MFNVFFKLCKLHRLSCTTRQTQNVRFSGKISAFAFLPCEKLPCRRRERLCETIDSRWRRDERMEWLGATAMCLNSLSRIWKVEQSQLHPTNRKTIVVFVLLIFCQFCDQPPCVQIFQAYLFGVLGQDKVQTCPNFAQQCVSKICWNITVFSFRSGFSLTKKTSRKKTNRSHKVVQYQHWTHLGPRTFTAWAATTFGVDPSAPLMPLGQIEQVVLDMTFFYPMTSEGWKEHMGFQWLSCFFSFFLCVVSKKTICCCFFSFFFSTHFQDLNIKTNKHIQDMAAVS